jgi:hypothetical protein
MESSTRSSLEKRLFEEVGTMLTEGDLDYLHSLSRAALGEAIENELRFLGLYAYGDQEAPIVIHNLVEQNLDNWQALITAAATSERQRPRKGCSKG